METVGRDITDINFSRGFAIELGSTLSVVLASVAGKRGVHYWCFTCPNGGLIPQWIPGSSLLYCISTELGQLTWLIGNVMHFTVAKDTLSRCWASWQGTFYLHSTLMQSHTSIKELRPLAVATSMHACLNNAAWWKRCSHEQHQEVNCRPICVRVNRRRAASDDMHVPPMHVSNSHMGDDLIKDKIYPVQILTCLSGAQACQWAARTARSGPLWLWAWSKTAPGASSGVCSARLW